MQEILFVVELGDAVLTASDAVAAIHTRQAHSRSSIRRSATAVGLPFRYARRPP